MEELSNELQSNDSDQSLLDLFGTATQENDIIYQEDCKFDFTAGHLIPERFEEFGMRNGITSVQLESPLFAGDIKAKRDSKNVKRTVVWFVNS